MTTHSTQLCTCPDPTFKQIDNALEEYYSRHNVYYNRDVNENGLFLQWIIDEELHDPQLSISDELGHDCDPNDCTYTWLWANNNMFPISYAQMTHTQTETFIFYILQYCYKYSRAPSDGYIQHVLVPKCFAHASLPQGNNGHVLRLDADLEETQVEGQSGHVKGSYTWTRK